MERAFLGRAGGDNITPKRKIILDPMIRIRFIP
jgi:hypothetical protein